MGGQSKSQIVGYKYSLYAHFIFGAGVADFVSKIWFRDSDTIAWEGKQDVNGIIEINKPDLFGGSSSQGGVVGEIAFMNGSVDQLQNDYQVGFRGEFTQAYRGVMGIVWQDLSIGMNPYLPTWGVEWSRIHKRMSSDGVTDRQQWYDEKAAIPVPSSMSIDEMMTAQHWDYKWYLEPVDLDLNLSDINKAIDIDLTDWTVNQDKVDVPFESAVGSPTFPCEGSYFGALANTIMWYRWNFTPKTNQRIVLNMSSLFQCDVWLNGNKLESFASGSKTIVLESNQIIVGGNNVLAIRASGGQHGSPDFFGYRLPEVAYTSNGFEVPDYSPDPMSPSMFYVNDIFNATSSTHVMTFVGLVSGGVDPVHGIEFFTGFDATVMEIITGITGSTYITLDRQYTPLVPAEPNTVTVEAATILEYDMNPIHIIREFKTEPWSSARIDEPKLPDFIWQEAADTIYSEGLGMTFVYDGSQSIEGAMSEVCRHIGAETYSDRRTGEFKIKLVRNDYDIEAILHLDESSIIDMSKADTPVFGQLTTDVVVNYTDAANSFVEASITVQDIALAQMQGKRITANLDYKGFTSSEVAGRKAQQMLNTLSKPLQKRTFIVRTSIAKDLNKGDVFKFSWSRENIVDMVMRVTDLNFGNGISNRIMIDAVQDEFALPDSSFIAPPVSGWTPPFSAPLALNSRLSIEAPYLELVQLQGQSAVDLQLQEAPESGFVLSAAGSQTNALKAMMFDGISTYSQVGVLDFCPTAVLVGDYELLDETFTITSSINLDQVEVGTWCQIGSELLRVVSFNSTTAILKHGCLDTIPAKHFDGDKVYFWDNASLTDSTEFVDGNMVNVKLLTINPKGQLSLGDAPVDAVEIVGRAARPYNMANVKLNDVYYNASITGDLVITWANRNRLQQTSGTIYEFHDGNITIESGVTYNISLIDRDDLSVGLALTGITGTSNIIADSILSGLGGNILLVIESVRDGLVSYQKYEIPFVNFNSTRRVTTYGSSRITTDGTFRTTT